MMKYFFLLTTLFLSNNIFAQYQDFVILNNGDTLYCDILENYSRFRAKESRGEKQVVKRRRIIWYNGFHGIIAKTSPDSFYYLESNMIRGYYQHNDFIFRRGNSRLFSVNNSPDHDRLSGYYQRFDLKKLANHNRGKYRFRFILATEANERNFEYKIRYNSPYKLYICWLSIEDNDYLKNFILTDGKDLIFISRIRQIAKASKKYGIPSAAWRKGGGGLSQFVLRFQYALNDKLNN